MVQKVDDQKLLYLLIIGVLERFVWKGNENNTDANGLIIHTPSANNYHLCEKNSLIYFYFNNLQKSKLSLT